MIEKEKTYLEFFIREERGDYTYHPNILIISNEETLYYILIE